MSVEEIKRELAKLNARQRREVQLYLLQLRTDDPQWRKETAKRNRELAAGKGISLAEARRRLGL